ncbi:MAG TPA: hypothetical protein VIY86_14810, partial [Pirellulaceae bacterium]
LVLDAPFTLNVAAVDDLSSVVHDDIHMNSAGRLNVHLTNPNATWVLDAALTMNGGSAMIPAPRLDGSDVELRGSTTVSGHSLFHARVDLTGSTSMLIGTSLTLSGGTMSVPNRFYGSAAISGGGTLVIDAGSGLAVEDNAVVGNHVASFVVRNHGQFEVGFSAGVARITGSYEQGATAQYEAEIDGLTPGTQYDLLLVDGDVDLAGTLTVPVNDNGGSYTDPVGPGTLHNFVLILAGGAITGEFDNLTYDGSTLALSFTGSGMDRFHVGSGLFRILDYDPARVDLLNYRALLGDANGDGVVDGSDFGIWNSHKFTTGTDWTTGDFNGDGVTDGSDFGIWNAHKFTNISLGRSGLGGLPSSAALVPEPSGMAGVIMLLVLSYGFVFRSSHTGGSDA